MKFSICEKDMEKIESWLHETVYPPILEKQKKNDNTKLQILKDADGKEYPYFGASGGDLTYEFTPTTLGLVTKVVHASGPVLDLTDYNW